MQLIFLIFLLILLLGLGHMILGPNARQMMRLFSISIICIIVISILFLISHHYSKIDPVALILLLIISVAIGVFYNIRRLR